MKKMDKAKEHFKKIMDKSHIKSKLAQNNKGDVVMNKLFKAKSKGRINWVWLSTAFTFICLIVLFAMINSNENQIDIDALESSLSELEAEHLNLIKSLSSDIEELREHEHESSTQPIVVNVNQESEVDAEDRKEQEELCEAEAKYTDTCVWQDEYDLNQTRECDPGWYCHVWRDGSSYVDQCKKRKCEI